MRERTARPLIIFYKRSLSERRLKEFAMEKCCPPTPSGSKPTFSTVPSTQEISTMWLHVNEMDCQSEVSQIQNRLENKPGVHRLKFDLEAKNVEIGFDQKIISVVELASLVKSLGYSAKPVEANFSESTASSSMFFTDYAKLAIAGVLAISAETVELTLDSAPAWIVLVLSLVSIGFSGIGVYKKGLMSVVKLNLNINALMSIAVTGAFAIGQWPEAAMVMFLFSVAELIEAKAFDKARNAFKKLLELAPDETTVKNSSGEWQTVDTKTVVSGTTIRVRPGERISLDGVIERGNTSINQAPITGESIPVDKRPGDQVFAGTINEGSEFEFKSTSSLSSSTLSKIVDTIESAQGARAPTQRFIDKFSAIYTPAIFVIALAVAVIPPLFMSEPWYDWLYKALILLVIACPCALVISTPVTIVSGLSGAAKRGILIKGGMYLEKGVGLKTLALDKTGTITSGRPHLADFKMLSGDDELFTRSLAKSLASRSDHPVSQAIAAMKWDKTFQKFEIEEFTAVGGRGVTGRVEGKTYYLANHRYLEELNLCSPETELVLESLEKQGMTVTILASKERAIAVLAVIDTVRPTSKQAIIELHKLGVQTVMLSGDNQLTADKIAKEVGIDRAKGLLLPEDKLKEIEVLLNIGPGVGMVGDGINDAPALARADIGFSMGVAGTDVAIETSDVAIMDDDLRKVARFIEIAKSTKVILWQNIGLAIGIKAVFFVLTLLGLSTMWMAVFADTGASLLVVLNGLRLSKGTTSFVLRSEVSVRG